MSPKSDLYDSILARRSVRRYERNPLDEATLAQVRDIIASAKPLVPENQFETLVRSTGVSEDLVTVLGAYGRIVTPPHVLAPHILGEKHLLEDLGYRVEQIAVRCAAIGIGSCYIGTLPREDVVRARFGLPQSARIGALLVFGRPATAGGHAFNSVLRSVIGSNKRLPPERLFFQGSFTNPATPPATLAPLIEAGRHAPSAVNAQPWRFLWRDGRVHVFVTKDNARYGNGPGRAAYCLYDGGICMANISLAMEALGTRGRWLLHDDHFVQSDVPEHPADLRPLATLVME